MLLVICFEVLYVQLQRTGGVDSIAWQYPVLLFALWLAVGLIATLTVLARQWSPLVPATAGVLLLLYVLLFLLPVGWVGRVVFSRIPYPKAGTAITALAGFYLFPAMARGGAQAGAVLASMHDRYPR